MMSKSFATGRHTRMCRPRRRVISCCMKPRSEVLVTDRQRQATADVINRTNSKAKNAKPSVAEVERRKKIAEAKRKNWQCPEYRSKMSEALQGKASKAIAEKWKCNEYSQKVSDSKKGTVPWNKGRKLSEEHRKNVSKAKIGMSHTEDTRMKMSKSQKRRYAAARVIQAVDKIVQNISPPTAVSEENYMLKNRIIRQYRGLLHDFRLLEAEIEPWVSQFESEHARKPTMADVQNTNIAWIINKYKTYVMMKQQLMHQIPSIRNTLENPNKDPKKDALLAAMNYRENMKQANAVENTQDSTENGCRLHFMASKATDARVRNALQTALKYKQHKLEGQQEDHH